MFSPLREPGATIQGLSCHWTPYKPVCEQGCNSEVRKPSPSSELCALSPLEISHSWKSTQPRTQHWRINYPSPGPSPTAILPSSKALCWGSSPAPEKPEAQTRSTCPALDTPASTTHTWGARRTELSRSGHDCHWINPQSLLSQPHSVTCKCMLLTEGGWSPLKHTGPSTCKWGLVHLWTPSVWGSSCGGDRQ